jgi:hypothetical protein
MNTIDRNMARIKVGGLGGPKDILSFGRKYNKHQSRIKKTRSIVACSQTILVVINANKHNIPRKTTTEIF